MTTPPRRPSRATGYGSTAPAAIAAIHPRTGAIVRRAAGEATRPQVVAAGVDLALIAEPATSPNPRRAERFAAVAAAGGVAGPRLVLTKADLADDPDGDAARLARAAGIVEGLAVSARSGEGLGILRTLLPAGSTAVLLGPSGAGKSTLANALLGEARQATNEVRASDDRGRHTTVTRELLRLPWGALLLDTPGVREIGLWDDGTDAAFADVRARREHCRFADCTHDGEPGCAVRGSVDPRRLAAWRKLQREQAWLEDRRAAERQRDALGRRYGRLQRQARRAKGNEGVGQATAPGRVTTASSERRPERVRRSVSSLASWLPASCSMSRPWPLAQSSRAASAGRGGEQAGGLAALEGIGERAPRTHRPGLRLGRRFEARERSPEHHLVVPRTPHRDLPVGQRERLHVGDRFIGPRHGGGAPASSAAKPSSTYSASTSPSLPPKWW
ncbi:MAG: ribosome small subunit-dependent GTPase A [Patulibacter minatonensis]